MPGEEDQFQADLDADFPKTDEQADPFEESSSVVPESEKAESEESKEARKNRRERRLEAKLEAERTANIELNARVQALSEVAKFKQDIPVNTDIHAILFGNAAETPESRQTALNLQRVLEANNQKAIEEATKKFEERQDAERKAQREAESFIDTELEGLEDEYDVDLTSNSPGARKARKELLELVGELSPKDSDGNIRDYADFSKAYEIYQSTKEKADTSRQRSLGSRGMVKSGITPKKLEDEAAQSYLKQIGIL